MSSTWLLFSGMLCLWCSMLPRPPRDREVVDGASVLTAWFMLFFIIFLFVFNLGNEEKLPDEYKFYCRDTWSRDTRSLNFPSFSLFAASPAIGTRSPQQFRWSVKGKVHIFSEIFIFMDPYRNL